VQSALAPAGRNAAKAATLFWWMASGAVVIWLVVMGLFVYALRRPESHNRRRAAILIIGGGALVPTLVLAMLLVFGLSSLPELVAPAPEGSVTITVSGEQWWWRVRYHAPEGEFIETANEIRLPVGEPVDFRLQSVDVIHSFWVPSLGGKVDMIPGRLTRLALEPTRTGVFRGVCAEYCGTSHALMAFDTVVVEKQRFVSWLEHQYQPARRPEDPLAIRGGELFLSSGCGACHAIRGTAADGAVGPDLTHVGSRLSVGAGTLRNEPAEFLRWIARTNEAKPDVHMPAFGMLPHDDLRAIAAYLDGLE
jgi:cytochrome c oxidase subunit 2